MSLRKPRTIFLLRLLQLNLFNLLVEHLRPFALTPLQYMVLSIASGRGGWSSAELARRFHIAPQSMTEIVASLERKKLIARSQSAEHGRILTIRLTPAGARLHEKCDRAVDRMERDAFEDLAPPELDELRELMSKALTAMRSRLSRAATSAAPRAS
jgi:DNA-binding MarR family transcriptional regulator